MVAFIGKENPTSTRLPLVSLALVSALARPSPLGLSSLPSDLT